METVIGIDVAKDTLAISEFCNNTHQVFTIKNSVKDIQDKLIKKFKTYNKISFVCESTGVYHLQLANLLYQNNFTTYIVNPFIIKKYSQMNLKRVKTDSMDAQLIAEFGYENRHRIIPFKPKDDQIIQIDNLIKTINNLNEQKTIASNQKHALKKQVNISKVALKAYENHILFLKHEIKNLEKELQKIVKTYYNTEYELLISIPGIGLKVSSTIITIFESFKYFQNAKQASSFIGLCPSPYESGSSIKKRGSISKRGNSFARKVLYMGALNAIQFNPLVKAKYTRLINKGKTKMVALIAAANTLLRIAFGVLKSGKLFDLNYLQNIEKA